MKPTFKQFLENKAYHRQSIRERALHPYERMFEDLSEAEQLKLEDIKHPDEIKTVKVIHEWRDDGQPCIGVEINDVPIGFWWLDNEQVGAFHYHDSPKAKQMIFNMLEREVHAAANEER